MTAWDDMERIWNHTFSNELHVSPEDHFVMLTEPPQNVATNRPKMTEIMFETFKVSGFYLCSQPMLSLYAIGRITGIVLECGEDSTYAVPIYNSLVIGSATKRLDIAGRQLTENLTEMLQKGYNLGKTGAALGVAQEIKEKLCFVAPEYNQEPTETTTGKIYELPDGKVITLGDEMYEVLPFALDPC